VVGPVTYRRPAMAPEPEDPETNRPETSIVRSEARVWQEIATAAGTAALNLVPVVGGPLASLVSSYVGHRARQRVLAQIAQINERLTEGLSEVSAQTADQVVRLLAESARTTQAEKLARFRDAAVRLLTFDSDAAWNAALLDCVAAVETNDLAVLQGAREAVTRFRTKERFASWAQVAEVMGQPPEAVTPSLVRLWRLGLIADTSGAVWGGGPPGHLFDMTELGQRFLDFTSPLPGEGSPG
jgi:hypothetical protein